MNKIQEVLDKMAEAIAIMRDRKGNYIAGFEIIQRFTPEETWCRRFVPGTYVRPIWNEDGARTDGYYDIDITYDSPSAAFSDVWKAIREYC